MTGTTVQNQSDIWTNWFTKENLDEYESGGQISGIWCDLYHEIPALEYKFCELTKQSLGKNYCILYDKSNLHLQRIQSDTEYYFFILVLFAKAGDQFVASTMKHWHYIKQTQLYIYQMQS